MRFFVSYSRRDQAQVSSVARRLNQLGHEAWMDDKLTGGQAWWDEIVSSIQRADAFLFALSEASLESQACTLERGYARALGKPLLPVAVDVVAPQLLPPDLAAIQFVDYSKPGEEAAIQLAGALARVPPAPALPDPLPPPPAVPVSYLSDLSQLVFAESLSLSEQRSLVVSLEEALRRSRTLKDPDDHQAALDLLRRFEQRADLYAETDRRIKEIMASDLVVAVSPSTSAPAQPPPERVEAPVSAPAQSTTPAQQAGPTQGWQTGQQTQHVTNPTQTGWLPPNSTSPPTARKTPRWIIALAVIGVIFLILMVIGLASGAGSGGCFVDQFGTLICP
jgi:TIR domain